MTAHSKGYYGEARLARKVKGKIVGRSKAVILDSGKVIKINHEAPIDVVTDMFGFESKWRLKCPKKLSDYFAQAATNCPEGLIPVAVIRDKDYKRIYYIMEEKDWLDLHI